MFSLPYHSTMTNYFPLQRMRKRRERVSWILFASALASFLQLSLAIQDVNGLEGEAGFRMVSLTWKYPPVGPSQRSPISFQVKFCELHTWGVNRCRYQHSRQESGSLMIRHKQVNSSGLVVDRIPKSPVHCCNVGIGGNIVDEVSARNGRQETSETTSPGTYLTDIGGLRMATNYTFQVIPLDPGTSESKPSRISLQTKGFSAKATNCLADSSEVIVETGPFFGGRISVEDSTIPGCFIKGNPQSPQTKYKLQIRNKDCGSVVNGSRVTTVILVQENVPILTHSTRRFVVVCSFSPESFVVKAGVSLPRETSITVAKSLDFSRLIRISPQTTNLLNADTDTSSSNQQQDVVSSNFEDGSLRPISQYNSLTQANPASAVGEGRAFSDSLHQGTWETFLVFGMICVAIIASMASVVWFIRSYRVDGLSDSHRRGGDVESLDGSSGYSYDSSTYSSSSNQNSLDTRSDFEVELDFEFSEDVNRNENCTASPSTTGTTTSTKSSQHQTPKLHSYA